MEFTSAGDPLYAQVLHPAPPGPTDEAAPAETAHGQPPTPAPTLVLLHPTPLDHRFWEPVLPTLRNYRLLVPDLRGHGRSPLGQAASSLLSMAQLAQDAVALLDALHIERALFIGCSIGGYTLYELWRTVPERIAGLVFCSSKPQSDNEGERARRNDWIAQHEAASLAGAHSPTPAFLDAMQTALLAPETREEHEQIVAKVRFLMEQVSPEAIQAIQRGLGARPDSRSTVTTITVPTCVIAGEHDASSTPADLAALHSLLLEGGAPSEFHVLPRAGHYAPLEQPVATAEILYSFCRNVLDPEGTAKV